MARKLADLETIMLVQDFQPQHWNWTNDEKKQLTINDGDWAGKVSKELEAMGIIDDAVEFDKYLSDNGYSNVINSGTYDVSPDDTFHELAEKITSRFR